MNTTTVAPQTGAQGDGNGIGSAPTAAASFTGGQVTRSDGRVVIGRVGAPPRLEATSEEFHFWVPSEAPVEQTQIVTCESEIGGTLYTFYALVQEVRRCSRRSDMAAEVDAADGDLSYQSPYQGDGYTYATARILRTEPPVLIPPREGSDVLQARPEDAATAYRADEIASESRLPVGLTKNGGSQVLGPGSIDLDYLLGRNGGHMNVNGSAGRGTKSSWLLHINWLLLREARRQAQEIPSDPNRLRIVPIILNVKNFDLFFIDQPSSSFDPQASLADWQALGVPDPAPFQGASFYAPQQPGGESPVPSGRSDGAVQAYSWSLRDVIERGLFGYLFADKDTNDANFGALALDIETWLTREQTANDGTVTLTLQSGRPDTFSGLRQWLEEQIQQGSYRLQGHAPQTWRKLYRRLLKLLLESRGVLRRDEAQGNPLDLVSADTTGPRVVDLSSLSREPEAQRFVVAALLKQIIEARTGASAVSGLIYVVTLDELNRFAPRGARDPITQLVEFVASEMRSQGIILFSAQQQASLVSEKVLENAAIRVLGRTGAGELSKPIWQGLSASAKRKADSLPLNEKLVIQDNFPEPMQVRVPFPAWAMNPQEKAASTTSADGSVDYNDNIDTL